MKTDKKYLNIPQPMLSELYKDHKEFLNNAIDVGVYLYSKTLIGSEEQRYRATLKFFGIKKSYIRASIANAKDILNKLPNKYPMMGIEMGILWDYYENHKEDYEIICLGVFLAVKSILGAKSFRKTNKAQIHARMFGYNTVNSLPEKLTPLECKYQIRWHIDKVLLTLQTDWHLSLLSNHLRGMYISLNLSHQELAIIIEQRKQKTKVQQLKESKLNAYRNAKTQFTAH